ncbi:hypothetical protein CCHR01_17058 [Colletotrichum chrysophilum]|uniref:Uncharacterized protein n=1 Tax=Colletotrichum chrysophilum TaxID=1836956 RepID=A0AAD9A7C1_9PEZI|nr:hypothetical protein CCHR01_17058 [Colletotrichum chrysophilum]
MSCRSPLLPQPPEQPPTVVLAYKYRPFTAHIAPASHVVDYDEDEDDEDDEDDDEEGDNDDECDNANTIPA